MKGKTRIGILGIGAVGGYFGGLLADKYFHSGNVEVIFITKPSSEKKIKEKGLRLITPYIEKIIHADVVTSNPDNIGPLDYLICSVKSYDLEESLIALKNVITEDTIILPLLNGVDANERISKLYPHTAILEGCVYIVARLVEPGVVKETGNIHVLNFGSETVPMEKLQQLEKLFLDANIDCHLSSNIEQTIWEKFMFISSIATLTSYLNLPLGGILENPEHKNTLKELLKELKAVAEAKRISLSDNILEKLITRIESLPYGTTSSMHSDYEKGGKTEYRSLTEYVCIWGDKLGVDTPAYDIILLEFKEREKGIEFTK